MKVEFFRHGISEEDIARAANVMRSVFLTTGRVVEEFEGRFAAYLGVEDAVGVASCTAALHLSLIALGIGPGDEVITTPLSFCATANAILHAGARPVFVDVEEETGNINAELIENSINLKTRAVMPVHLYGQMCDMARIRAIAQRHALFVIEDAAHAIEAERDGIRPGQASDAACFSFYATKNITSGEGGAIATGKGRADLLRTLRLHGMDKSAADRYTTLYRHYDLPVLGYKENMTNISAALLIGQLNRIETLYQARDRLWKTYEAELSGLRGGGLGLLKTVAGSRHARHLFTVLTDAGKRDALLHGLQERGVGVAVNFRPIHLLKYYRENFGYREGAFPVAEDIGQRTISLPLYPGLGGEEQHYVIETLKSLL